MTDFLEVTTSFGERLLINLNEIELVRTMPNDGPTWIFTRSGKQFEVGEPFEQLRDTIIKGEPE